ncbi:Retrovirus-related Pol polyprotein from transposon [Halotydeus destructor]|nr:Retrovirus-related Pol polyprotein from transposon [Halotydeus destructor]
MKPLVIDKYWDTVHIDIAGSFPTSMRQNQFILIAIDHASKWVEGQACRDITSDVVAKFLLTNIYLRHGSINNLVSDRGTQFLSHLTQSFLKLMRTKSCPSTAWHPQTNGQVENFNKTVVKSIKKQCGRSGKWDEFLPFAIAARNFSVQATTAESPYKLLHKEEPRMPIDIEFELEPLPEYLQNMRTHFAEMKSLAVKNAEVARERQKVNYDSKHENVEYTLGQKVLIVLPSQGPLKPTKLSANALGPFEIIEVFSPLNYRIRDLRTGPEKIPDRTEHVSRLRPYHDRIEAELSFEIQENNIESNPTQDTDFRIHFCEDEDRVSVTYEAPEIAADISPESSDRSLSPSTNETDRADDFDTELPDDQPPLADSQPRVSPLPAWVGAYDRTPVTPDSSLVDPVSNSDPILNSNEPRSSNMSKQEERIRRLMSKGLNELIQDEVANLYDLLVQTNKLPKLSKPEIDKETGHFFIDMTIRSESGDLEHVYEHHRKTDLCKQLFRKKALVAYIGPRKNTKKILDRVIANHATTSAILPLDQLLPQTNAAKAPEIELFDWPLCSLDFAEKPLLPQIRSVQPIPTTSTSSETLEPTYAYPEQELENYITPPARRSFETFKSETNMGSESSCDMYYNYLRRDWPKILYKDIETYEVFDLNNRGYRYAAQITTYSSRFRGQFIDCDHVNEKLCQINWKALAIYYFEYCDKAH